MTSAQGDRDVIFFSGLEPVSRKSRELFGPEKPFVKVQPAYSILFEEQSWLSWLVRGFLSWRSPVRSSMTSTSASTFL